MAGEKELDPERRDFLGLTTAVVGAVGVAAACWPFVSSMNPSKDIKAAATARVDLGSIPEGKTHTVEWQGKPVFVVHRTEQQIAEMAAKESLLDRQRDEERVQRPQWLVVVGICTHLGCVPNRTDEGWSCPCHGSMYDNSGRVVRGPAPKNLIVPHYEFTGDDSLIIGRG